VEGNMSDIKGPIGCVVPQRADTEGSDVDAKQQKVDAML